MAQQTINVGAAANDGNGDDIRSGGQKINANFTELYTHKNLTTGNPHGVSKSEVGLSNVINSLQVINGGGFQSLVADTIGNRPSAGTDGRWFYATDTHQLFRDNGTNWILEKVRNTTNKDANYTATINDEYIGITTVPHTLTLPQSDDIPDGKELIIKDETGNANVDNITINPDGTNPDTIDGLSSFVMNQSKQSIHLLLRGTNWNITAEYAPLAVS